MNETPFSFTSERTLSRIIRANVRQNIPREEIPEERGERDAVDAARHG
jgi:hypothetical protein